MGLAARKSRGEKLAYGTRHSASRAYPEHGIR